MTDNSYCKSCEKEVGPIVERGHYIVFAVLSVVSFIGLLIVQVAVMKETPVFGPGGLHMERSGYMSDWWLLLPIAFVGLSIKSFLNKKIKCPICNSSI